MRPCNKCGIPKVMDDFRATKCRKTGREYHERKCRACYNADLKDRRTEHRVSRAGRVVGSLEQHQKRVGALTQSEERKVRRATELFREVSRNKIGNYRGETPDSVFSDVYERDPLRWHQLMTLVCFQALDDLRAA